MIDPTTEELIMDVSWLNWIEGFLSNWLGKEHPAIRQLELVVNERTSQLRALQNKEKV